MTTDRSRGLTGNQLKLLALGLMTIDHVGMFLLPQYPVLRIIGRLAMPIFAYMIAEGCCYTRNKGNYLLRLAFAAMLTQLMQYHLGGSLYLYQTILVTFTFSLVIVITLDFAKKSGILAWLLPLSCSGCIWFICERLGGYLPGFAVDYGFVGVLLPVIISLGKDRLARFWLATMGLALLCWYYGNTQWCAMGALMLLAFYNGKRGKAKLKWLFYLYFPAHLALLYILADDL